MDRTEVGIQSVTRWPSWYTRVSQWPATVTVSQPVCAGAAAALPEAGGPGGLPGAGDSGSGVSVIELDGSDTGGPGGGGVVG